MDFGVSRKAVAIAPYIDPNGFHTGIQRTGNVRVGIVTHKYASLIGYTQKLGGVIENTAVRFMDTYLAGHHDDIKQRGKTQCRNLIALELETVRCHIGDNGGFDAHSPQLFYNRYLLRASHREFVNVVEIIFLAIL